MNENCCFPRNTQIVIEGGRLKAIQDIQPGEYVLQFDEDHRWQTFSPCGGAKEFYRDNLCTLNFINQTYLILTDDHPLLCKDYTWKSLNPTNTLEAYGTVTGQLAIGDKVLTEDGTWLEIVSWTRAEGDHTTYSLQGCQYHNFFAGNGGVAVCAHNKAGDGPTYENVYHPAIPAGHTQSVISVDWTDGVFSGNLGSFSRQGAWADHKTVPLITAPGTFDNVNLANLRVTLTLSTMAAKSKAPQSVAQAAIYNIQLL